MPGMFYRKRPDGIAVRRIKALVSDCLQLTETTLISVMELNCHEPGCPPTETVITARYPDGSMRDWRIAKPKVIYFVLGVLLPCLTKTKQFISLK